MATDDSVWTMVGYSQREEVKKGKYYRMIEESLDFCFFCPIYWTRLLISHFCPMENIYDFMRDFK